MDSKSWATRVQIPQLESDQELAEAIRDSLELMGWAPWWKQNRQPEKYEFGVQHFGKEYEITTHTGSDKVEVIEKTKGLLATFNSLHFLAESIPNAPWYVNSWQYYQDFTIYFILFSILSGVYLWFVSKQSRLIGLTILVSLMGFSGILMFYLWVQG